MHPVRHSGQSSHLGLSIPRWEAWTELSPWTAETKVTGDRAAWPGRRIPGHLPPLKELPLLTRASSTTSTMILTLASCRCQSWWPLERWTPFGWLSLSWSWTTPLGECTVNDAEFNYSVKNPSDNNGSIAWEIRGKIAMAPGNSRVALMSFSFCMRFFSSDFQAYPFQLFLLKSQWVSRIKLFCKTGLFTCRDFS